MREWLTGLAIAATLAAPAAAGERWLLVDEGPMPQGHPWFVQEDGVVTVYPVVPRPLQFAIIEGRRALVDPETMRVVYWLRP